MIITLIIQLFQNIAILLAFSMLYANFWVKDEENKTLTAKIITGLILSGIGVILMYTRWTYVPGIVFDTRSVMLTVAGLFFGGIPTLIAIAITAGLRIFMGGDGVYMGVAVIISSGSIGLLWRKYRSDWKEKKPIFELLALGIVVHLTMLALSLLLPSEEVLPTLKIIFVPVITLYPLATMLLGMLMMRQWVNYQNKKALEELTISTQKLNIELKIAKEKAEESDRLKSAFLANLSHEIRTPMNSILGFTDLLKEPGLSVEARERYNSMIHKSGNHLLKVIDDIIEISKIETGQVVPHLSRINLYYLFNEIKIIVSGNLISGKNIELRTSLPPGDLSYSILSDEVKLKQIMINLINNAIKYTDTGFVEFGFTKNETLDLFVKDTGIGIDKIHHKIIFERFRQVDGDLSVIKGGAGLGLAIAKAYTEILGGKIKLESEPGKGSAFIVSFPLQ